MLPLGKLACSRTLSTSPVADPCRILSASAWMLVVLLETALQPGLMFSSVLLPVVASMTRLTWRFQS